jgi:hypothetical protein
MCFKPPVSLLRLDRLAWSQTKAAYSTALGGAELVLLLAIHLLAAPPVRAGFPGVTLTNAPPELAENLDNTNLTWRVSLSRPWTAQSNFIHEGTLAARSAVIADNELSPLETTVTGPATLSFWWAVSSRTNAATLRFLVDGEEKAVISGSAGWEARYFFLGSNLHTLHWVYAKSNADAAGMDAAWLDQVQVSYGSLVPSLKPPALTRDGTNHWMSLAWLGDAAQGYALEHKESLTNAAWHVETITPGNGTLCATQAAVAPGEKMGFYRLRQLPRQIFWSHAIMLQDTLDVGSFVLQTDSYDSADTNYSSNGRYDLSKRKDNGGILTGSVLPAALRLGASQVLGRVATGPGGTLQLDPQGCIGSLAWFQQNLGGIQPGYVTDDAFLILPSIPPPATGGYAPTGGIIHTTNYSAVTGLVTTATLPAPLPAGPITTNLGIIISNTYPFDAVGDVTTNLVPTTTAVYPTNAAGAVQTNFTTVITNTVPDALLPFVVSIVTNVSLVTNATLPTPAPSPPIVTNTVFASIRYPDAPMPPGPPSDPPIWEPPYPGTYVGVVTNRYVSNPSASRGWWHDFQAIQSYTYQAETFSITLQDSYTYDVFQYQYLGAVSYSYYAPTGYSPVVASQTYDLILDAYNYAVTNLTGKIYVRGQARLKVLDQIEFTGEGGIVIGPGASLELYMAGATADFGGKSVENPSGQAAAFKYFGQEGNTTLNLQVNQVLAGCILAPHARVTLISGAWADFMGACACRSLTLNGNLRMHYDEAVGRMGR